AARIFLTFKIGKQSFEKNLKQSSCLHDAIMHCQQHACSLVALLIANDADVSALSADKLIPIQLVVEHVKHDGYVESIHNMRLISMLLVTELHDNVPKDQVITAENVIDSLCSLALSENC